ncbi:MAG TPA: hypothetical protein VK776_09435 [Bryobacteraceae bacterium]|nr:hypothetical protein [Bryobacteraceae bacterium]
MRPLLVFAIATGCASAAGPQPDATGIIARSVQAIEADWKQAPEYSYLERDVESKHHSQPTVKTYEVLMIDGSQYNRLVAINDHPLSTEEQAEEENKLRAEVIRRGDESERERRRRIAKFLKERDQNHAMLKEMVDAFDFHPAGEATVDGHDCWVFDAEPKPGYQPKTRETKVLSGMQGKLWIDKSQFQWVRVEAEVMRPVSMYAIARVGPGTHFFLEQAPVSANLWLPTHFSVNVKASALGFINEDSLDDETYRQYKPMPNVAALEAQK